MNTGSITDASKLIDVSYRTALNYINKIETALNVSVVSTSKGGKGGGGGAILTPEGRSILKECKKINAIMQLHRDVNEIETVVSELMPLCSYIGMLMKLKLLFQTLMKIRE